MFTLFPQLPADIRRQIWLATLGPMTVTFTGVGPLSVDWRGDLKENRRLGNVSLPDGSYNLYYYAEPSAAYITCKESREFLSYIFVGPVTPEGSLPSWFDPAIDTIRFERPFLVELSEHPWFKEAQYLWIRINYEAGEYLSTSFEYVTPAWEHRRHRWVEDNLGSLQHITFEMKGVKGKGQWLNEWFPVFDEWFNHPRWELASYSAQVICYQNDTPEEEWLTPQNYLRREKQVHINHYQQAYGGSNWKEMIQQERDIALVNATDEELEKPGEFLKKHNHFGI
ncbi:hypothetical protein PWT90_03839 [Aphanocladium album]|nr:hypothetical protein PWT90_03839 [Aphanocladium album]